MKKVIKPALAVSAVVLIAVLSYFIVKYYFTQCRTCETKLNSVEVQWAISHPDQVLKAKESYEAVHKAADEVYFGILEQGKEED